MAGIICRGREGVQGGVAFSRLLKHALRSNGNYRSLTLFEICVCGLPSPEREARQVAAQLSVALPDDNQVTTARDQALLGRTIQKHFPRAYKYFSSELPRGIAP